MPSEESSELWNLVIRLFGLVRHVHVYDNEHDIRLKDTDTTLYTFLFWGEGGSSCVALFVAESRRVIVISEAHVTELLVANWSTWRMLLTHNNPKYLEWNSP